jgi:hypothetical protein
LTFGRIDGLEPKLPDALLPPALPARGIGPLAAEERACSLRVPGATLVVADSPGAGREERVANGVQRLRRHEHNELPVHGLTFAELIPPRDCGSVAPTDKRRQLVSTTATGNARPLGQPRGVAFVIILSIITLGIYSLYWVYKTQEEMKQHTGDGLGGVLGLVVWILISPVSGFVIPSEIGNMYRKDGKESPVSGWTGLWLFPFGILIIPIFIWYAKVQGSLNRYWESKASQGAPAATAEV